ncbi:MAG: hypothetical protein ABSC94_15210 [Polyangiaceae bacterium]|jgi:hypothetical protein
MGLEAECTVRVGRKRYAGKATLEGEKLAFRGEYRLDIPLDRIRNVDVDGDALVVRTDEQEARFHLGVRPASRWFRLIKEPKGLFEKLEVTAESRIALVDISDSIFVMALRERTAGVTEGRVPQGARVIFFGVEARGALRRIPLLRARMVDTGVLWVVRPKASKAISEADVLSAIRAAGLTDTKVVALSRTHTAHKAVIPIELRGLATRPRAQIASLPPTPPSPKGDTSPASHAGTKAAPLRDRRS